MKTVEKIKDVLSEYYAQLPSYEEDMVRATAEHMFSKSVDEPIEPIEPVAVAVPVEEKVEETREAVASEDAAPEAPDEKVGEVAAEQNPPEE